MFIKARRNTSYGILRVMNTVSIEWELQENTGEKYQVPLWFDWVDNRSKGGQKEKVNIGGSPSSLINADSVINEFRIKKISWISNGGQFLTLFLYCGTKAVLRNEYRKTICHFWILYHQIEMLDLCISGYFKDINAENFWKSFLSNHWASRFD